MNMDYAHKHRFRIGTDNEMYECSLYIAFYRERCFRPRPRHFHYPEQ